MAQRLDVQYIRAYTDGNAARKIAPVAPLKTMKLPKIKKHRRITIKIDPIAVGSIIMAGFLAITLAVGMFRFHQAQQELAQMQTYVQQLKTENAVLDANFSNRCDMNEVERTALALGFVPQEQVRHVSVQAPQSATEDTPDTWERLYIFLTGLFA